MTYKKRVSGIKLNYGRAGRSLLGDGIRHPILNSQSWRFTPALLRHSGFCSLGRLSDAPLWAASTASPSACPCRLIRKLCQA